MDDSNDLYLIFRNDLIVFRCYFAVLGDYDLDRIYIKVIQDILNQGFFGLDLFYDPVIQDYFHSISESYNDAPESDVPLGRYVAPGAGKTHRLRLICSQAILFQRLPRISCQLEQSLGRGPFHSHFC